MDGIVYSINTELNYKLERLQERGEDNMLKRDVNNRNSNIEWLRIIAIFLITFIIYIIRALIKLLFLGSMNP